MLDELGGRIDAVLDSGPCPVGVESTVLDLSGERPTLLRPGGATLEAIEALIGPVRAMAPDRLRRCGRQACSPRTTPLPFPFACTRRDLHPDEALLAFGPPLPGARVTFNLSERGDLTEAAARLFAGLRWLDAEAARQGLTRIAVMPVPETGLGRAINDRLRRAAAPR